MTRAINVLVIAFVLVACGASQRAETIRATYITTVTAHQAFLIFDHEHEKSIKDAATSYDQGRAALDAYRLKSDRVMQLFDGVYKAVAAALVLNDNPMAFANLVEASSLLMDSLRDITGGKLP
ncbi:MAG: hypothetical protein AB7O24_01140 [Kofleriaceae bacterium]